MQPGVALVGALALATLTAVAAASGYLNGRIGYLERAHSPHSQLYEWARTNTPQDAIFAVPPSNSEMRSWSRRAIVVNFKAFPFQDELMIEWHRRLRDMSNNAGLDSGFVALTDLDASYEALADVDLIALSEEYGFSYVVRQSPIAVTDSTHQGWENVASFGGSSMRPLVLYVYRREPSRLGTR